MKKMKISVKKIVGVFLFLFCIGNVLAQDIRINQNKLPYTIPLVELPTTGERIIYQWLENNQIIENSNQIDLTIPKGKEVGVYTFVSQVKCNGCTDWLSSNTFTVEIHNDVFAKTFTNPFSVLFSPQKELSGYLEELINIIDQTQTKLDISIYGIDSYDVYLALKRANVRGVQIRMLYEGAKKDRNEISGTVSHKLEEIGIDVKYVNKTNHHKFIVSDDNYLMTSSGNWNTKANWEYDESSLFITEEEIILRYRAEFELLWNNSREFGQAHTYTPILSSTLLSSIIDNPDVDAVFTTSNYSLYNSSTYGPTFRKITNKQDVSGKIVSLINGAQTSIKIAANHLRSRPICEALIQKKSLNPSIDIKIYTDQQEFITQYYNDYQTTEKQQCLVDATTPSQERDCLEKNFLYSYNLILAGIELRFKSYSYDWDITTTDMMHHKYIILDDDIVAVGSYNYSYNAETNSMENLLIFNNSASSSTVNKFISNFDETWNLGRDENYYNDILTHLGTSNRYVPVIFPSVALTHSEYTNLKQQIATACPTVTHDYFKNNGHLYSTYLKGVNLSYDSDDKVISSLSNSHIYPFTIDYKYNSSLDRFSNIVIQSSDNINYFENYQYDSDKNITSFNSSLFNLNLSYSNNNLSNINYGQGDYTWQHQNITNGTRVKYSNPNHTDFISSDWNENGLPIKVTDIDNRNLEWIYDNNEDVTSIFSENRSINIVYGENKSFFSTNSGEHIQFTQNSPNNFDIVNNGTVATSINYDIQEQTDKKQTLIIGINSTNITSGRGRIASVDYLFDAYGRVINSGSLNIIRKPYSGEITDINNGNIEEDRTYNDLSLLTEQVVKYSGNVIYQANYQYDGMQRIKQLDEIVSGITTQYIYQYNARGQLEEVLKNGVLSESYIYDNFGNRTTTNIEETNYTYQNNNVNQTEKYSWATSSSTKHREFNYNNAGQLTSTVNKTGNTTTSSKSFNYDVFGNLNSVTWASQNLEFKYDAFDKQIATYLNGKIKRKLVYGIDNLPIAELNQNERIINTFVYADNNTPILMRKGSRDYYIVSDIRGSARLVIKESNGAVMQQLEYDAFGKVLSDSKPGYTPFGYAGGLYEFRSDLVHFGARDYFAEIGKWTAEDPIGFLSGDINFYSYVSNDPINYTDPSGFYSTRETAIVIGENMDRVNKAADDLKSRGYNIKTYIPRNFRSSRGNLNPKDINANRAWVRYWTNKGAKVFDIGPTNREAGIKSPFYRVEHRSIYNNWRYNNVVQLEGY